MTTPSEAMLPFLATRREELAYALAFREPFAEWQSEALGAWYAALPQDGDCTVSQGEVLHFRYSTGGEGEGVLLLPVGTGPHPAVVLLHDHGGEFRIGWRKMVAGAEGEAHIQRHYGGRFLADWLREQGYAVLVTDALGWGSRYAGGYDQQQALAAQAMQLGWSLAGIVAVEDMQAARWLAGHPQIDPTRIAAFGFSFGGFRAWQLAALSPHVSATVALSWMSRRRGLLVDGNPMLKGQSAFYMLHPKLTAQMDFPDMAGIGGTKPMFLRNGDNDRHFPMAAADQAHQDLRRIWQAPLDIGFFDGGHHCSPALQDEAADFLDRTFRR